MRIEIRSSNSTVCQRCGAHELLHTVPDNKALERDLDLLLIQPTRWYQFALRRAQRVFADEIERVCGELRRESLRV
jgi:hypothetical protein